MRLGLIICASAFALAFFNPALAGPVHSTCYRLTQEGLSQIDCGKDSTTGAERASFPEKPKPTPDPDPDPPKCENEGPSVSKR